MADELIEGFEKILNENDEVLFDKTLQPVAKELGLIRRSSIKHFVKTVLVNLDSDWWSYPVSVGDDGFLKCLPDEYEEGGLVLHTKRLVRACAILSDSLNIGKSDRDILYGAAFLHGIARIRHEYDEDLDEYLLFEEPMYSYLVDETILDIIDQGQGRPNRKAKMLQEARVKMDKDAYKKMLKLTRCQQGYAALIPETKPSNSLEHVMAASENVVNQLRAVVL